MSKVSIAKMSANLRITVKLAVGSKLKIDTTELVHELLKQCQVTTGAKIRLRFACVLKLLDLVLKGSNQ